ncbi:MAG: GatB/YqeY domain-containing protein [Candidatus Zixiibacteriota bacterium]
MSLSKKIDDDLIKALKAGEKDKVTLLRGLKSDIKYRRIEKGDDLSEQDIIAVLSSAAKRRRDSIEQFAKGNRQDLVDKENFELEIIQSYLPKQLSEDELRDLIRQSIAAVNADSPAKIGLVMKDLMPKVKGMADGKLINQLVGRMLSGEKD